MRLFFLCVLILCGYSQSRDQSYKLNYANSLFRAGKTEQALGLYKELYTTNTMNSVYYNGYKDALIKLGRYAEAIKVIEFRKLRSGQNIQVYNDLATAYFHAGDLKKAFSIWDEAVSFPKNQHYHFQQIANAMLRIRVYDKAIEVYTYAQKKLNNHSLFVFDIARFYQYRMSYDKSFIQYIKALKTEPRQYNYIRSQIFQMLESPDGKDQIAEHLDLLEEDNSYLLQLKADILIKLQRYEDAFIIYGHHYFQGKNLMYRLAQETLKMKQYQITRTICHSVLANNTLANYHVNTSFLLTRTLMAEYTETKNDSLIMHIDQQIPSLLAIKGRGGRFVEEYIRHLIYIRRDSEKAQSYIQTVRNPSTKQFFTAEAQFFNGQYRKAKPVYASLLSPLYRSEVLSRLLIINLIETDETQFKRHLNELLKYDNGLKNPFLNNALKHYIDLNRFKDKPEAIAIYGFAMYAYLLGNEADFFNYLDKTAMLISNFKQDVNRLKHQYYLSVNKRSDALVLLKALEGAEWMFKYGELLYKDHQIDNAKHILEQMVLKYPNSFWTSEARFLLETISKNETNRS